MVDASRLSRKGLRPAQESKITTADLRDAVMIEYNGTSDEFVIGGKVTVQEALELFKKQTLPNGIVVEEVSAGEIYGPGGKRQVWLPVTRLWGQRIKEYEATERRRATEINELQSERASLRWLNNKLNDDLEDVRALVDHLTRRRWWQFWKKKETKDNGGTPKTR